MSNYSLNNLQRQYNGFLNTAALFEKTVDGMDFFKLNITLLQENKLPNDFHIPPKIRLGQRMEYFMEAALKATNHKIIAKNLQIIEEKHTLGEIDFIVENLNDGAVFQLEMVYKFYLFDSSIDGKWTQKWIGGNRRDSLFLKLKKLKEKQLPLLYAPDTAEYLEKLDLKTAIIGQKTAFFGQLFLPLDQKCKLNRKLNPLALSGYWITKAQLNTINTTIEKISIPFKNDWVTVPTLNDDCWKTYAEQMPTIEALIEKKQSTLLWISKKSSELHRFFLVWWT